MPADPKPGTPDLLVGRKVGGYAVTRRIGQGGMGIVYEAKHERIAQQRAAIKVLHKELSSDEKVLQRIFLEAKAISMAQHSSIVKIFDFGQLDDGTAYIMMEFLEGETLQSRLERAEKAQEPLPLRHVVELGRQTATALSVIHEKNIVHRDLKPENIFIVPDPVAPMGERVKLLDFGIAKFLDGPVRKTTVGMILGTPLYMSPEQCEGSEDLDAKVDVYALGVMLYEMIAGHLPFIADTAAALMRQHMFKDPPPLGEQAANLPPPIVELVHLMLAKKPPDRPRMADIANELEAIAVDLGGIPSGAHALAGSTASGRRKLLSRTGEGPLDPFAKTMGGGAGVDGTPDPLASTLAEASLRSGRPGSGPQKSPSVSGGSLDSAKPAGEPMPVSMTQGSRNSRAPLLGALIGFVALASGAALWLRPSRPPTTVAVPLTPPPVPPSPSAGGGDKGTPPTTVATTTPTTTKAGGEKPASPGPHEPDPHKPKMPKKARSKKGAPEEGTVEDKKPKAKPASGEKSSGDQTEVWR